MSDSGIRAISSLTIDADKNWLGKKILQPGDPAWDAEDLYSQDYGLNWADLGALIIGSVMSVAYIGNGIVLLGDSGNRIYRSTDYGATWTNLGIIAANDIGSIAHLGNGIVVFGDDANHIFRY